MTGFVGSRARKRSEIFSYASVFSFIVQLFIFQLSVEFNDPIPDENLIPDPTEDLTSLARILKI